MAKHFTLTEDSEREKGMIGEPFGNPHSDNVSVGNKVGSPEEYSVCSVDAPSSAAHSLEHLKKSYDAEVKNFLKEKQVFAVIIMI